MIKMMFGLFKNISEFIKIKYFKNGQVGFREIVIVIISLIAGFLFILLVIRMLNVSKPK